MTTDDQRPATTCIVEDKKFIDQAGREIHQAVLVSGSIDRAMSPFVGHMVIIIPVNQQHAQQVQLQFPIDAVNIKEAFAMFDELADATKDEFIAEQTAKQRDQMGGILRPGHGM